MIRKKRECTQDYIPIVDIINGVVLTDDGRYIKILEVYPINFEMKSPAEQQAILDSWEGWLRVAPSRFTIKCITKLTSTEQYTKAFMENAKKETDKNLKNSIEAHCRWAAGLGSGQSIEHRFYIIFQYKREIYADNETKEDILAQLEAQAEAVITGLERLGNSVLQWENPTPDVCEFIYNHYNRRLIQKESFPDRLKRYDHDVQFINNTLAKKDLKSVYIKDILAPRSLNTRESPEYMIVDGMYYSHFYVKADYYPSSIETGGWLSRLINRGYGIEVDLHFQKEDVGETAAAIRRKRRLVRLKLTSKAEDEADFETVRDNYQALTYTKEEIAGANKQEPWVMNILISVCAYTKKDLYRKRTDLIKLAQTDGYEIGEFKWIQEDGFQSTSPFNSLTKIAYERSKHNVLTEVIKAGYPFTSYALNDEGGILMGQHQFNSSLAIYNPFDSHKYPNANMAIFGGSGRGKTFSLLTLTTRFRYLGIGTIILAPDKQDEFRRTCSQIGGEFVDVSASAETRLNPFDIWPVVSEADMLLNLKTGSETSWLTNKISDLDLWVNMLVENLVQEDRAEIKECLHKMYQKKGITENNDSLYHDKERNILKDMPTYSDFVVELKANPEIPKRAITVFEQFTEGVYKNLNGPTNVDLRNKYIVFGLENLRGELKVPMMFIMLKFIWSIVKSDKTVNKIIAIDEGSLLVDGKEPLVGDFVIEIFRMIRAYGGMAIFATQSIVDLYKNNGEFGNTILSNAHSKILMGMEPIDVEYIADTLKLSPTEASMLQNFKNPKEGRAILCAGAVHIPIFVRSSQREREMFDTSTQGLRELKEKMQKNNDFMQKNY